jgi:uncharacterized protein YqgV (UPF0045/DUF77 family)
MEATIEISMYPLNQDYEPHIIAFINELKAYESFKVRVNETSTHLFGDFDEIFDALKSEIKKSYAKHQKTVFVMKVLGANIEGSASSL